MDRIDFVIVLGGDGTMLSAVTLVRNAGVPMLGINLGRLGFLNSIEKVHIAESIAKLVRGQYTVEDRSMIYLESNPAIFGDIPFALNDCTLLSVGHLFHDYGGTLSSMVIISTPIGPMAL